MFRKLRVRLIISHALPILILTPVISLVILYLLETRYSLGNVANQLMSQGALITEITHDDKAVWLNSNAAQQVIERLKPLVSARVMLIDPQGRLLASTLSADNTRLGQVIIFPVVQQAIQGHTGWQVDYSPFMQSRIIDMGMPVLDSDGSVLGIVRLSYDITEIEHRTLPLGWLVIIVTLLVIGMALLLALLLSHSLSAPLFRLATAVEQLRPGATPLLLPESGPDEVRSLAINYNQMASRLCEIEASRRKLLVSIVHELGTPLGAIKAAAQTLENGAMSDPTLASELSSGISNQVDQLRLLLDDLTLLGETEMRDLVLNRQWINLGDLIQVQCQSYTYLVKQKQIELTCHLRTALPPISVDSSRINQILANLLHNAYKFTPPRGAITVSAELLIDGGTPAYILVQVSDTGPGIALAEQEKIFDLLYRSPDQRNLYKGMGIGLALSKRLAEAHAGTLSVESQPGQGATFSLRLPVR